MDANIQIISLTPAQEQAYYEKLKIEDAQISNTLKKVNEELEMDKREQMAKTYYQQALNELRETCEAENQNRINKLNALQQQIDEAQRKAQRETDKRIDKWKQGIEDRTDRAVARIEGKILMELKQKVDAQNVQKEIDNRIQKL